MADFPFIFEDNCGRGNFFTKVQPGNWIVIPNMKEILPQIYKMDVRKDDVWLLGPPKSGNTWATEMIWNVYHEADVEAAKAKSHFERWNFPELQAYTESAEKIHDDSHSTPDNFKKNHVESTIAAPSPRFIRAHLPLSLLPPNLLDTCKVVYIARNMKDCCVSYHKMVQGTPGAPPNGFEGVFKDFVNDTQFLSPWPQAIKEAWNKRNHENMYFLFFEDMKKDLPSVLNKMAKFLGKTLTTAQIEILKDHLSMKSMRNNESINMNEFKQIGFMGKDAQFVRKGVTGGWRSYFTDEMDKEWQQWWDKYMSDCDIQFPEV